MRGSRTTKLSVCDGPLLASQAVRRLLSCLILSSFVGLCEGLLLSVLLSLSDVGAVSLLVLVKLMAVRTSVIVFLSGGRYLGIAYGIQLGLSLGFAGVLLALNASCFVRCVSPFYPEYHRRCYKGCYIELGAKIAEPMGYGYSLTGVDPLSRPPRQALSEVSPPSCRR